MAKPEQTEKATPKRRSEARKRGQVAKSPDLAGAGVFLAGVFVLRALAPGTIGAVGAAMQAVLWRIHEHQDFTPQAIWLLFARIFLSAGLLLGVLFGAALLCALLLNLLQTGLVFSLQPLAPSFSKINPVTGLKRMFSKQVLVNLGKQLLKLAAVLIIVYTSVASSFSTLLIVGEMPASQLIGFVGNVAFSIAWKFGFMLVIIGLMDFAFERWQFEEQLKMSKQEVKDEMRQSEGNPEVRGALRRRQREFARRRMMAAVPKATVVVTNPTHFAVALEWDELKMEAPVVTAKGADLIAKRIREIAKENGVPIMENPPLARTLYAKVDLDQSIPPNMYAAVAQVIAFVFKLKRKTIA